MGRTISLGLSSAASWAWGVSFLLTYTLIQGKGIVPFAVWAFFNTIAVPVFGLLCKNLIELKKMLEKNRLLLYFVLIVQFFSIIINLQAIYQMGTLVGISSTVATFITMVCGTVFVLSVYHNLFNVVLYSNVVQWLIVFVFLAVIIILIPKGPGNTVEHFFGKSQDVSWSFYAGALLMCSPFVDLQGWIRAQKIDEEKRYGAFVFHGIFFGMYMLLIFVLSKYKLSNSVGLSLFLLVIMIATSTIQPNAYALKNNMRGGLFFALLGCLLWPFLKSLGILTLWTWLASFRGVVVILMLIALFIQKLRHIKSDKLKMSKNE